MATVTETYADNSYYDTSLKKTWTVSYTYNNFTASESTFTFWTPTITAKFVGSVGLYRRTELSAYITIGSTFTGGYLWLDPFTYTDTEFGGTAVWGASNATFTMTKRDSMPPSYPYSNNYVSHSRTLNTSDYFNSRNKTTKTVNISADFNKNLQTAENSTGAGGYSRYMGGSTITIGTLTLDAPPTFTASALSKNTSGDGYYKDATTVTTTISGLSAKYGGTISSVKLTIGSQSVSRTTNGTLSITLNAEGTFTPTVVVTDSRGQTTTQTLSAITVTTLPPTFDVSVTTSSPYVTTKTPYSVTISNASSEVSTVASSKLTVGTQIATGTGNGTLSITPTNAGSYTPTVSVTDAVGVTATQTLPTITVDPYLLPTINFDVYRTNANGVKNDEGHNCLIIATMTCTSAVADFEEPSIEIDGTPIDDVISTTVAWYSAYDSTTGVSGLISDWSTISSGATVYGVIDCDYDITGEFDEALSYQITVTANDSLSGHSTPITQTMSTAFYTIDFQAGGKEIAFGAPANDDVTNYEEGLFKCAMSFRLKDHLIWIGTRSEYDDAVDDGKMPEHSIVIITDEDADYIVDQGTSGIWTYRKWSSGIAECWGRADNKTVPSGWSSSGINLGLPFTFLTMRNWQIQHQNWQISNCYGYPITISNTYDNINIQTYSSEAMSSAIFMVFCQGTWK